MRKGRILAFDEAEMLADAQAQSIALQQRAAPTWRCCWRRCLASRHDFRGTACDGSAVPVRRTRRSRAIGLKFGRRALRATVLFDDFAPASNFAQAHSPEENMIAYMTGEAAGTSISSTTGVISVLRVKTSVAIRVPPMLENSASRSVAS